MKRFTGLSLIPVSEFVAQMSLLFVFPLSVFSQSCSYHHFNALHCSHGIAWHGMEAMAWQHRHMQHISIT